MSLFDAQLPPATRRTDPEPSRLAADMVTANGMRATHCARVLSVVRKYPKMTAVELLPFVGLERHEISRRLADLESRGLIRKAGQRKCRTKGTVMTVWEAM